MTLLPRSKLEIAPEGGYYMLTLHRLSSRGRVEVSRHRLRGGRRLHYGEGRERTDIYLSDDRQTLQLAPGEVYKRKVQSTDFSTINTD